MHAMHARTDLPQLSGPVFLADGGLETTLIFHEGLDLPEFAAFPLLEHEHGRAALDRYYRSYLDVAARAHSGIVLDTPTWRANPDWGRKLGYAPADLDRLNEQGVRLVAEASAGHPEVAVVVNGAIGPRGDGYVAGSAMTVDEAEDYHRGQIEALARAGADLVTAVTMTSAAEAIGVARAARRAGVPAAIGVTVETDGRLPSGESLAEAIDAVDAASDGWVAYFMVNCAHPSHFASVLAPGAPWLARIKAIRANASRMTHAELDEAEHLDRGSPHELARDYEQLCSLLPDLRVVGGCCGTDVEHIAAIAAALRG